MDRTIALNRPVKKVFSVLLVIGLLALAPFLISYAATLILEDLTDLSISSPALEPAVRVSLTSISRSGLAQPFCPRFQQPFRLPGTGRLAA